ncbi:MAG: hypothetical protein RML15_07805 [Bacteroidota bacterium]|nr:hypothetical protein [Bacteroidota bacterium]
MKRGLLLAVVLGICMLDSIAQQPVVQVRLFRPPPNQLRQSDLWRIQLNNLSREAVRVYLVGIVTEAQDGEVVNTRSAVITLKPGPTQLTANQLEPIKLIRVHPKYRELYLRTGEVPSGNYTACAYVRSADTDEELGSDCFEQSIQRTSPPILVQPRDGDTIPSESRPVFTWLPPTPIPPGVTVTYTLRIVEMLGRQTPFDAMLRNPAYFERTDLRSAMLQYPLDARPFRTDRSYAWKVSAYAGQALLGESEVWHFIPRPSKDTTGAAPKPIRPTRQISALAAGLAHSLAVSSSNIPRFVHLTALKPEYLLAALDLQPTSAMGDSAVLAMVNQRTLQRNIQGIKNATSVGGTLSRLWTQYLKGNLFAWGDNHYRQAVGTERAVSTPQVQTLNDVVAVAAGYWHSLAITSDGRLWGWGRNDYGQLADASLQDISQPRLIPHPTGKKFVAAAAGERHTLALDEDGVVWGWGCNFNRELGSFGFGADRDSAYVVIPKQLQGLEQSRAIACGVAHSMALTRAGTVVVWGSGYYGQTCQGPQAQPSKGTTILKPGRTLSDEPLGDIIAIAAGDNHCLALARNGEVWAWGDNRSGQAHPDSGEVVQQPAKVLGLDDIIDVAAGCCFSVALRRDSTVWVWGDNTLGLTGSGNRTSVQRPTRVPGLSGIVRIAAGGSHILALRADGTLFAWGNNNAGQLGRGTVTDLAAQPDAAALQPAPVLFGGP